ncbi:MAG: hypothetical protein ACLGIC_01955 [Acidimicrobiia bacterium]
MLPEAVLDLFARQYSVVARQQVGDRCTEAELRRVVAHPDVERVTPRVLRHRAGASSLGQDLMLAVLDAGDRSILWGRSAMHWWGFGRFRAFPAHVARRRSGTRAPRMARIHNTTVLRPDVDVTVHRGIPIARPERLILWLSRDLTGRYGHELAAIRLGRTLDHAWREGLIDGHVLHALADRCGGRGNAGIVVLRQLLDDRPPTYRPTDSGLERRWEEVVGPMAAAFRRQVVLGGDSPIGRFDQVHVSRPLVVEIHSEKFHTTPTDVERDEQRLEQLVAAGFSVVVYWEYDIWHDAGRIRRSLADLLGGPDVPGIHRPTPAPHAAGLFASRVPTADRRIA